MKSNKQKITFKNLDKVTYSHSIGFKTKNNHRGFLMAESFFNSDNFVAICARKFNRKNTFGFFGKSQHELIKSILNNDGEVYAFENEWALLRWLANSKNKSL